MDSKTAMILKLNEFDKLITETKASAAALEAQKASFIYEAGLKAAAAMEDTKGEKASVKKGKK